MPAAAVIPAPIAYIKVVAVKKLVVGFRAGMQRSASTVCTAAAPAFLPGTGSWASLSGTRSRRCYFEKIRVFKAGLRSEYISME